jgi:hypothetical protein
MMISVIPTAREIKFQIHVHQQVKLQFAYFSVQVFKLDTDRKKIPNKYSSI